MYRIESTRQIQNQPNQDPEGLTRIQICKIAIPHFLLIAVVIGYLLIGAVVFAKFESDTDNLSRRTVASQLQRDIYSFVKYVTRKERRHMKRKVIDAKAVHNKLKTLISKFEGAYLREHLKASDIFDNESEPENRWNFASSVLFSFTVMTTIGYGHIAPVTVGGRLFCMFYGLVGIPLTIIAIADIGKFLAEGFGVIAQKIYNLYQTCRERRKITEKSEKIITDDDFSSENGTSDKDPMTSSPAVAVLIAFLIYIIIGAVCLPLWESMDFFTGIYFSFVTITTCGFGDVVPTHKMYLFPTLLYITLGLSITTLTIDVSANYFRRLHYLGAKINDAKEALVWFGNKVLTVSDLVKGIGKEYGLPEREIHSFLAKENFDTFIETAVYERELELLAAKNARIGGSKLSLKGLAPLFEDLEFRYIDDSVSGSELAIGPENGSIFKEKFDRYGVDDRSIGPYRLSSSSL